MKETYHNIFVEKLKKLLDGKNISSFSKEMGFPKTDYKHLVKKRNNSAY